MKNISQLLKYFVTFAKLKGEKIISGINRSTNFCLNKSSREVEKEIAKREPEADKRQDVRYSSEKRIRMSLNISEETHQNLEKLRHKYRCKNLEEVIERLAKKAVLADQQKKTGAKTEPCSPPAPEVTACQIPRESSRHIPSVTKKIVLKKVERKCCYKDPKTGEECNKVDHLEFDHIQPFSKGGPHLAENLRLLCSHHNKRLWQTEQKNM